MSDLALNTPPAAPVVPPPAAPAQETPPPPPAAPPSLDLSAPPAPAPAAPPSEAPAAPTVTFEKTGDPGLDFALGFLGKLGMAPDTPEMQAALTGEFALLEAKLATMGNKAQGFEQVVALAKQSYERQAGEAKAKVEASTKAVLEAVGGQESWEGIRAWAATNIPEAERGAISAALQAGGPTAVLIAEGLRARQSADPTSTIKGAPAVAPNASRTPPASTSGMSVGEYAEAVQALAARVGEVSGHPEYAALRHRRELGRRQGR
ncbi:hypothetical protein UFOVP60_51 [uncultured Caudovirales phage]|uniref:Scaffolding protein n=1 Tax=uncultured Caudovirales phage TaxID=2100421 RepID=A0A6J5TCX0_9CAUD|nr:hypothetical protein UFOVP60_51 [uncultured Caudovirales phage]